MIMTGNSFGKKFIVTTFGESHGNALGCVIDGCPFGVLIDENKIQTALDRRKPNSFSNNPCVTTRSEQDKVEILSGVFNGKSTGTPICMIIRNKEQHSKDYENLKNTFRPGHADFTYDIKYNSNQDFRGGGRSSGRETVARVAAGAIANEILLQKGIKITAYTIRAAGISCKNRFLSQIEQNNLRVPDNKIATIMEEKIKELREKGESAGGIIEDRKSVV